MMRWERVALILMAAVVAGLILNFDLHYRSHLVPFLLEAFAISAWVMLIATNKHVKGILLAVGARYRVIAAVLIVALVSSHLAGKGLVTFPFVEWEMYGHVPSKRQLQELQDRLISRVHYEGHTRGGRVFEINADRFIQSLGKSQLATPLARMIFQCLLADPKDTDAERRLAKTLKIAGRIYNRDHRDDPLVEIRAFYFKDPLVPHDEVGDVDKELLLVVRVDREPDA